MANLKDKTIVVTGGTLGIGEAAARALRKTGARVVITGRSPGSEALAKEMDCEFIRADYSRLSDVRALAQALLARCPRIDVLANNVGGVMNERTVTEDGHEKTFQVNHLAGFLLTELLRERLEASGATVINTASAAHHWGHLRLDDLENARHYLALRAYGTAKLMNILHARELNRRFKNVRGVSFHPGSVATGFARAGSALVQLLYTFPLKNIFLISPERGADTLVWLASSEAGKDWQAGEYYYKRRPGGRTRQARSEELARELWDASARMVGG
jgi:NAD(P)-dependent dehydrogenase (short-subunit alcohol dehydrogenase family)